MTTRIASTPLRDNPINALARRQQAGLLLLWLVFYTVFIGKHAFASILLDVARDLSGLFSVTAELITRCPGAQMILGAVLDVSIAFLNRGWLVTHFLQANGIIFNGVFPAGGNSFTSHGSVLGAIRSTALGTLAPLSLHPVRGTGFRTTGLLFNRLRFGIAQRGIDLRQGKAVVAGNAASLSAAATLGSAGAEFQMGPRVRVRFRMT